MSKFKTIYYSQGAFGGVTYRATSDGKLVNLQSCDEGAGCSTYTTRKTITVEEFNRFAEEYDIFDAYNRNPAHLHHLLVESGYEG